MQIRSAILILTFIYLSILPAYSTQYHIGPGQAFADIDEFSTNVGFENLVPYDEIFIHYRTQPYRSFILINTSHLNVIGVPNADGDLPILDGAQAMQFPYLYQDSNNFYTDTDGIGDPDPANPNIYTYYAGGLYNLGLITIGRKSGSNYTDVPTHIQIENLEIRNAHQDQSFTPWFSGLVSSNHPYASIYNATNKNFGSFASGIRVQRGENITIKNCHIHQCGNGIFVNSVVDDNNGNGTFDTGDVSLISRNILIEHNNIHDNGCYDGNSCHNIYCEASGAIYQYNHLGGKKSGSNDSNCLKDRSAGTIIRYNYIEGIDQGHLLDLVEAEASAPLMKDEPNYHNTYVYGNILINPPTGPVTPIHYGGDHCNYDIYRRGNLYFFNNTFVNIANQSQKYRTSLFFFPISDYFSGPPWCTSSPSTFDETLVATNNVIYNAPFTIGHQPSELYLLQTDLGSNHSFQNNFISNGYQNGFSGVWDFNINQYRPFIATVAHLATFSPQTNEPGFIDINQYNFNLSSNAFSKDLGESNINPLFVSNEYVNHQSFIARYQDSALDLGAYEIQNPLSIAEYSFNAHKTNNQISLDWRNLNLYLSAEYVDVFKLNDTNHDVKLTTNPLSHTDRYIDTHPKLGWNYYKICGPNHNKNMKCTEIRSVYYDTPMAAYPNPAHDMIILPQYEGFMGHYTIWDNFGRLITTKIHDGSNTISLDGVGLGCIILKSSLGIEKIIKI